MEKEESTNNRKRPGESEGEAEKRARLDKRNERDRARRRKETNAEKEVRLAKRDRDRARKTVSVKETQKDKASQLKRKSTAQQQCLATQNPEERAARLQNNYECFTTAASGHRDSREKNSQTAAQECGTTTASGHRDYRGENCQTAAQKWHNSSVWLQRLQYFSKFLTFDNFELVMRMLNSRPLNRATVLQWTIGQLLLAPLLPDGQLLLLLELELTSILPSPTLAHVEL